MVLMLLALPSWPGGAGAQDCATPGQTCVLAGFAPGETHTLSGCAPTTPCSYTGTITGCTPSDTCGDDGLEIDGTTVVDVIGDLAMQGPNVSIQVRSGSELRIDAVGAGRPVTIELGSGEAPLTVTGLAVDAGARFNAIGGYLSYAGSGSTVVADPSDEDFLRMGKIIPCPVPSGPASAFSEPDCAATRGTAEVMIEYTVDASNEGDLGPFFAAVDASTGAGTLNDGRLLLCIFDEDPTDDRVPYDVNDCYRITGADSTGGVGDPYSMTIDPRQTSREERDTIGYALSRRGVRECVLTSDASEGTRTFTANSATGDGGCITGDGERNGHWVYFQAGTEQCGDGDGVACSLDDQPYLIQASTDGGWTADDTFRILDVRGFPRTFSATGGACGQAGDCRVWIMPGGWSAGDPLRVRVPVVFRSWSPEDPVDSQLGLNGEIDARGVFVDGAGRQRFGGPTIECTQIRDWVSFDAASEVYSNWPVASLASECTIQGVVMAGGDDAADTGGDDNCMVNEGVSANDAVLTIDDAVLRHCATSCIENGVSPTQTTIVNRTRCEHSSSSGHSFSGGGTLVLTDVIRNFAGTGTLLGPSDSGTRVARNLLGLGGRVVTFRKSGSVGWSGQNWMFVGFASARGAMMASPFSVTGLVARENAVPRMIDAPTGGPPTTVSNCLFRANALSNGLAYLVAGEISIDNCVWYDEDPLDPAAVMLAATGPTNATFRQLSFFQPEGKIQNTERVFSGFILDDESGTTIDSVLIGGWHRWGGSFALDGWDDATMATATDICLFDNDADGGHCSPTSDCTASIAESELTRGPPGPGQRCGAVAGAGISQPQWFHGVTGIAPEFAPECGDRIDDDGDGRIDYPDDPGCSSIVDLSEKDPGLPCDDGVDNDGDGRIDFDPVTYASPGDATTDPAGQGDPGCWTPLSWVERSRCQDGLDNDGDGKMDYDGGRSIHGTVQTAVDPECAGTPWKNKERSGGCGLGCELTLLLTPLMWLYRRRRGFWRKPSISPPRKRPATSASL
jgi:hypothetical protein